jgi:hypothetical protein
MEIKNDSGKRKKLVVAKRRGALDLKKPLFLLNQLE